VSDLPLLHPDRVSKALRWFQIERETFEPEDVIDVGAEYDTAIAALKALAQFQKTCRLTSATVDSAIAVRGFFDSLKGLTSRLK
jgi:hypothetical protein